MIMSYLVNAIFEFIKRRRSEKLDAEFEKIGYVKQTENDEGAVYRNGSNILLGVIKASKYLKADGYIHYHTTIGSANIPSNVAELALKKLKYIGVINNEKENN